MTEHWQNTSLGNIQEYYNDILYIEEWKPMPIDNFEDVFEVSSFGRIKNVITNTIRKGTVTKEGYSRVHISNGKKNDKMVFSHIVTAKAFIPNHENLPEVNHLKGNKLDNRFHQLEWTTRRGNIIHAFKIGLSKTGENHGKSKLLDWQALAIFNSKDKRKELAIKYNISESVIKSIRAGRSWSRVTNKYLLK